MTFDGFFIQRMCLELQTQLHTGRLDRVYQTSLQTFRFVFHTREGRKSLVISADSALYGAYLSTQDDRTHIESPFSKVLKKHLEGAIIERITQFESDRVMLFQFLGRDLIEGPITKTLIFEAMGRHSNLILVEHGIIIDSLKRMFQPDGRKLVPGGQFEFFASDKAPFFNIDYHGINGSDDLVKNYLGISPMLASYLFRTKMQIDALETQPTLNRSNGRFHAIDLFDAEAETMAFPTLSALLDGRHHKKSELGLGEKQFITNKLKSLSNRLSAIEEDIRSTTQALHAKDQADLIYMSGEPLSSKRSDVFVGTEVIMLDPTKTLNENAQALYQTYHKAKRGLDHLQKRLEQTNHDIETFEAFLTYVEISDAKSLQELSYQLAEYGFKTKVQLKKHLRDQVPAFISIETPKATYAIGKNASQNAYLTHTYAHKNDTWFHVRNAPGSHVIVRSDHLDEDVIRTAAMLAAHFSKMRHSSSVPVDYTAIRYIRKIPGKDPSLVTYSHQKTIFIDVIEDIIERLFKEDKKHR